MAHEVTLTAAAAADLDGIKVFERRRIVDEIEAQLADAPGAESKRKKVLKGVSAAAFEFDPPLWELRVGEFRVFYDVDDGAKRVIIRSVRRKRPDQTTEDVLNETGNP